MCSNKIQANTVQHNILPIYDENSRVLILGTMPSPISRQKAFYYANPQNRFWRVLQQLFDCQILSTNKARTQFLLSKNIALWDVLQSCEINGAADSSIKNAKVNDIMPILKNSDIKAVFTTGAAAYKLYTKYCLPQTGIAAIQLPSTSPANARFSLDMLVQSYSVILNYIK